MQSTFYLKIICNLVKNHFKHMGLFVAQNSIVRKIWGKSDTVLFIFAGASAEFALNKAVDWLYFTGKLPSDPLGRLFSTVGYARKIVFASTDEANKAIDMMRHIHNTVEQNRGTSIPDWAYRDVLFMLIHYSIAAFELLERKLTADEKEEVYNVFYRVGIRMGLKELPKTHIEWIPVRNQHLIDNLQKSHYTTDLFRQYKKHLGIIRYKVLIEGQKLVVPQKVSELMNFGSISFIGLIIPMYKLSRAVKLDSLIKSILLPSAYKAQIKELDVS
ncbi:oxygenase MpaB family protein [Flavobacterium enshiense]|uniref:oxygenase MpaB family protein n=1 Tax=Flavobacterium enshiense TaxID=1341165 RepID=UPI00345CFC6F